jgi:thiosulfate/3-mercaptopyruvate sulfurtransferase
MLRWVGHTAVQVLDGGLQAWQAAGGALQGGPAAARAPGRFSLRASNAQVVSYVDILHGLGHGQRLVVDARAPDRFRGENETLDPVGGHIPGAANRFFKDNLGANGCFKPADPLRSEWLQVMGARQGSDLVMQCGSGVTACHNALALEVAGLPGAALYAGSWSEWCRQPDAPVALGA